jgi:ferritin-like metal-binding protein YciE
MVIRKKSGLKRAKKSGRMRIKNSSLLGHKNISINEKLALYLNDALSIENAAIKRLQLRLRQTRLPDIKVQLQHHLDETKEQQNRLKRLISSLDQKPTNDRGRLPVTSSPRSIEKMLKKSMTDAEEELKGAKDDAIVESAEIVLYDMLIQFAQKASVVVGGDAIPVLSQNLAEERAMLDWIKANTPVLITQLWPDITSSVVGTEEVQTEASQQNGVL